MLGNLAEVYEFGSLAEVHVYEIDKHAELASNKANKILGMICRSFDFMDGPMLVQLSNSLVRPHLEYGKVVWSPINKKDVNLVENVQRRATKLVPSIKNLSYEERLEALKLPSLVYRRLYGDLIETFRCMHSIYNVENNLLTKDS